MKFLALFLLLIPTAFAQDTIGTIPLRRSQPANLQGPGMGTTTTIDRQNPTMDSTWVDHRWIQHSVTTPHVPGETQPAQAARHVPAVWALQREFPAIPTDLAAQLGHGRGALTPPPGEDTVSIGPANDSVMHSSWKDVNGVTHSVSTPRQTGETVTAQAVRHAAAVNALALVFKPVNPSTLVGALFLFRPRWAEAA